MHTYTHTHYMNVSAKGPCVVQIEKHASSFEYLDSLKVTYIILILQFRFSLMNSLTATYMLVM